MFRQAQIFCRFAGAIHESPAVPKQKNGRFVNRSYGFAAFFIHIKIKPGRDAPRFLHNEKAERIAFRFFKKTYASFFTISSPL